MARRFTTAVMFVWSLTMPNMVMGVPPTSAKPLAFAVTDNLSPGGRTEFTFSGVQLQAHVPLSLFPNQQTQANDVWGYVSSSGREYAIIGFSKGTGFVEVTPPLIPGDPYAPQIVGYVHGQVGGGQIWRDMAVYNDRCYIVADGAGGPGLQVVDLRFIDSAWPPQAADINTTDLGVGFQTAHNIVANPDSGFLYLCGSNEELNYGRGLVALDVRGVNANNPVPTGIAGIWEDAIIEVLSCHDALVITYDNGPYAGREIAFCFAGIHGLKIVDVTDKSDMFRIGSEQYPNASFAHQGWISDDRRFLFLGDELDELSRPEVTTTTTYVIDIQNLAAPDLYTTFTNGLAAIDHNMMVRGNQLFEANYTTGLRVFDITRVDRVREIAYFDTYGASDGMDFLGAWGVYTQLPSRNILVSDQSNGLLVLMMDCNENGIEDHTDVLSGTSLDLNDNDIPDECDGYRDCNENDQDDFDDILSAVSSDCNENFVPDECDLAAGTSFDCNANASLDECDLSVAVAESSGDLSPFGADYPQSLALTSMPRALSDVLLSFVGRGDLRSLTHTADVTVNGVLVGTIFDYLAPSCSEMPDTLVVARDDFNQMLADAGGNVTIEATAAAGVAAMTCRDPVGTRISIAVTYNGIDPDKDCNLNGLLDICEPPDGNGDGSISTADYNAWMGCFTGPCVHPPCEPVLYPHACCAMADMDRDGDYDLRDFAAFSNVVDAP